MQAGLAAPLVASLAFASVIAAVLAWPAPVATQPGAFRLPHAGARGPAQLVAGRPAEDAQTILARPLFNANRRPPAAAGDTSAASGLPRLSGILVRGDFRRAVFETEGGGKPVVIGAGGRVGPYVVRTIAATAVTVFEADGDKTLHPVPLPSDEETTANARPPAPVTPTFLPAAFSNAMQPGAPPQGALPGSPNRHVPSPLENLLTRLRNRH